MFNLHQTFFKKIAFTYLLVDNLTHVNILIERTPVPHSYSPWVLSHSHVFSFKNVGTPWASNWCGLMESWLVLLAWTRAGNHGCDDLVKGTSHSTPSRQTSCIYVFSASIWRCSLSPGGKVDAGTWCWAGHPSQQTLIASTLTRFASQHWLCRKKCLWPGRRWALSGRQSSGNDSPAIQEEAPWKLGGGFMIG